MFDEISRLGGSLPQWRAELNTTLNRQSSQNAVCFLPTCLGYLRKVLLCGALTSSSVRTTVRNFAPLDECGRVYDRRESRLKIFVSIFRSVKVTADIPTENGINAAVHCLFS
jgi:hypothetical protein